MQVSDEIIRVCAAMHHNSDDGADTPPTDPPEQHAQDVGIGRLSAADCLHLAEECLLIASLTKDDPEKVAELIKTADDYLRRAAKWLADRIKEGQVPQ
jgi:hypothetical protein